MDRELKPNQLNHIANLSILHGAFHHGRYYIEGIPQLRKDEKRVFSGKGTIYFNGKFRTISFGNSEGNG